LGNDVVDGTGGFGGNFVILFVRSKHW
jgi:hypothetical protein